MSPAQRIFDAMRHQLLLSFKNSAHMMRATTHSDTGTLAYKMLYIAVESHEPRSASDGAR